MNGDERSPEARGNSTSPFNDSADDASASSNEYRDCSACQFYRQATAPSAVLQPELAQYGPPMLELLGELWRDESEATETEPREVEYKRQAREQEVNVAGLEQWSRRPVRQPYCGMAEREGVYFICEVKNFDHACGDFRPLPADDCGTCDGCSNNRVSVANMVLARLREVMSEFTTSGGELFRQVSHQYEMIAANQVRGARSQDGRTIQYVSALPYCHSMSTGTEFVVSTLFNTSGHCARFTAGMPRIPEWLDDLVQLYRAAKTTHGTALGMTVRNDPRHLAQAAFISAALQVLGLGSRAQAVVESLVTAAQMEQSHDVSGMAHLAAPPHLNW